MDATKIFYDAHTAVVNARERVRRRFDQWVKVQRAQGVTQQQLAERVRHGQAWVSKATARGPRLEHLDDIASLMNTTPAKLVSLDGDNIAEQGASTVEDAPVEPDPLVQMLAAALKIVPEAQRRDAMLKAREAIEGFWNAPDAIASQKKQRPP